MKLTLTTALLALPALTALLAAPAAQAQIAGTTTVGMEITNVEIVTAGWSARRQILGKTVYNQDGEQVGKIDDLIVGPGSTVSTIIIGAGGFVGLNRHQVAIPVAQLAERDGQFLLPGATKAAIKALPPFEYARPTPIRARAAKPEASPKGADGGQ
jgi:PRC-barrel domain